MNRLAHPHDLVRVHDGVTHEGRNLGGVHLTVTDVPAPGVLRLTEWTGSTPVDLPVADVDVVTRMGVAS